MKTVLNHKLVWVAIIVLVLIAALASYVLLSQNHKVNLPSKGPLIIGQSNSPLSLDPAIATDIESFEITSNIYETLIKTDVNGIDLLPGLAESWKVSEDGLTFVFKIREGIYFHDGSEFNADAVVFNFNRWMDKDSPYHTGHFTYWNQSFGGDPGIVKSITALAKDTVELVLYESYTPILSVLSLPSSAIASPKAIVQYNETLGSHPVGTGPYMLDAVDENGDVLLKRNEDYWGPLGNISSVRFTSVDQDADYVSMLEKGQLHIINRIDEEDTKLIDETANVRVEYLPFLNISYLVMNHNQPPFDQLKVRQAVGQIIDRDSMVIESYNTLSRPAYSFLPPTMIGYSEIFKTVHPSIGKAKKLLEEAGYRNGFSTELWVMDQPRKYLPNPVETAYFIKDRLKLIDIDVTIRVIEWNEYIEALREGQHPMALAGWQGDYVDPDNFLFTMFYSSNVEEGTVLNYSFYSNDEVDEALRKGRRVADEEFRSFIYSDIQQTLFEDMAALPLAHTMTAIGVSDQVDGFMPNISGKLDINEMDLKDMDDSEVEMDNHE